ncbi:Cytochrome p450 oxidoreductase [Pyrenophora tritici-repentis]|nr:Cytochrome p450 oxidoreductase [Pyrenophora tritici-repentis]
MVRIRRCWGYNIQSALPYGFMEERKDVHDVIAGIDAWIVYGGLAGQIQWLHEFLLGNLTFRSILAKVTSGVGDPLPIITQVRIPFDYISLAGSDTTAISLRATFYHLLQNRETYESLRKEIGDATDKLSPTITYAESLQLVYLQACMKEAMRMHPGVAYPLERVVPAGGTKLCDKHIPAGTIVGINASVIHRDTNIFGADADEFRPERWLNKDVETIKSMDRYLLT